MDAISIYDRLCMPNHNSGKLGGGGPGGHRVGEIAKIKPSFYFLGGVGVVGQPLSNRF
jgi:hypothetical protein